MESTNQDPYGDVFSSSSAIKILHMIFFKKRFCMRGKDSQRRIPLRLLNHGCIISQKILLLITFGDIQQFSNAFLSQQVKQRTLLFFGSFYTPGYEDLVCQRECLKEALAQMSP